MDTVIPEETDTLAALDHAPVAGYGYAPVVRMGATTIDHAAGLASHLALFAQRWNETRGNGDCIHGVNSREGSTELLASELTDAAGVITALATERATLLAGQERAIAEAVERERASVVAWLRGDVPADYTDPQFDIGVNLASAIELGKHRTVSHG